MRVEKYRETSYLLKYGFINIVYLGLCCLT